MRGRCIYTPEWYSGERGLKDAILKAVTAEGLSEIRKKLRGF